ncbi:ectonucleoside triphosphate diphosphohydrolase 5-like isoform X4 [Pungitius pungitius]|uniref:ectonucleoside triphosphate diphosphohydrolase 5-like isoform X4 n=1 Tax=Pungitius pungitius TaxID=134920 RepID=UPI002E12B09B
MKLAGRLLLLLLLLLLAVGGHGRVRVKTPFLGLTDGFGSLLPKLSRPANHSRIFYAVMFDAGSTGTRVHVYTFIQSDSEELPILDNEMFHSIKPGLSAYADSPEAVQHVFDESPFLVPDGSVGVMNGTYEGILAWISVNYLTGHLSAQAKSTVGILDLGGGSTQITFLPNQRETIERVPVADYVARFGILNTSFELYTYSYLGNGLMAARLATLGALGAEGLEWRVFKSSCLPKKFRGEWSFGELTYRVSGDPDGFAGYKLCYQEVLKVVKGIIHQPYKLEDSNVFYAFSYYFDRAVDAGLIDEAHGGMLEVRDFKKRAKEVCDEMTKSPPVSPFLCMDMTYITCLLKDGFGFKESAVLKLTKKVNNVEASWALGAMLEHFHNLKIQ